MGVQTHDTWDVGRVVVVFNEANNDGGELQWGVGSQNACIYLYNKSNETHIN